jgi:hypothetical protein
MCRMNKATSGLAALLLIGMAACVDLNVTNENDPDTERALRTPGDVESLVAGAYSRWLQVQWYDGFGMMMANASGEHVAPYGNAGMEMYSRIPRVPTSNAAGAPNVGNLTYAWFQAYGAIAAVRSGLKQIEDGAVDLDELGADPTGTTSRNLRARAFSKYMLGLAHASIAAVYDSGFIYDEGIDPENVRLYGYHEVMDSALAYLGEAITLAGSGTFTIPATWMSQDVSSATLVRLAYSQRARFRAAVARTPTERAAVDWTAVAQDAANGVTQDWNIVTQCFPHVFCEEVLNYLLYWNMQNNWVAGMADTSGAYQAWIGTALLNKTPFLIHTPDTRWPQGATEATQIANPGAYYSVNQGADRIWVRPDRGTWRWSYYMQTYEPFFTFGYYTNSGTLPQVKVKEMEALIAEAAFRANNFGAVATFVNASRTAHGLLATDAAGTNTNCVPKLPNGTCGNLWEMFKWEKRLETQYAGPLRAGWWLDGRGWGDLMQGTLIQFPVPYREMQLLQQTPYDFGGAGGQYGAPVGTYGY